MLPGRGELLTSKCLDRRPLSFPSRQNGKHIPRNIIIRVNIVASIIR